MEGTAAADSEMVDHQGLEVDGSTTQQVTSQRQPAADETDRKSTGSRDNGETSSPSDVGHVPRDSDLLLSARRTSIDYLQKVTYLLTFRLS